MSTNRTPLLLVAVILLGGAARAQDVIDKNQIRTLIEFGFGEADILEVLGRATELTVSDSDLSELRALGATPGIVAHLQKHLAFRQPERLDAGAIATLWKSGIPEPAIRDRIEVSDSRFDLKIQDVLTLTRVGVPDSLLLFMRERKPRTKAKSVGDISKEDVLKLSGLGVAPDAIIRRIQESESQFDLTADDVVALSRDGVPRPVLKEMYQRRRVKPTPTIVPETMIPTAIPDGPADDQLHVYSDRAGGFSMLAPQSFVTSKEFKGRKALIQMIDAASDPGRGLPDLELSVLRVHPPSRDTASLTPENLSPIAEKFIGDLERRFASDGIRVLTDPVEHTWLSNYPAVRVGTKSTTPEGVGHAGANYLVFAMGRIYVISYSVRLEMSHEWRQRLESCVQSFSIDGADVTPPAADAASDREQIEARFAAWRTALRHNDFHTWRALMGNPEDGPHLRTAFLQLAREVAGGQKRLEIREIDVDKRMIHYNVFGLEGRTERDLRLRKTDAGWTFATSST